VKVNFSKAFQNDNFLSLSSNLGIAIFGFLSFFVLVRTLSLDVMGEWVLYLAAGNVLEMLRFGLTRTAIIRYLSGAKGIERKKLIGTNWALGLFATIILAALIWILYFIFPTKIENSGYYLFFLWYPLLSIINLPFNMAISVMHADQRFGKILLINIINYGGFFFFLVINYFFLHWGILEIIYTHIALNIVVSIICLINKWDGIQYIFYANKETNKVVWNFSKYSTGTLIGSNLLKFSDQFLISMSVFVGTTGVAMYAVPLKLTQILEIPLRSFAAVAFPRMSKASLENDMEKVKQIFYSYSGGLTFLILPILIIGFIFAEQFVHVLGGAKYIETQNIFRIFCVYGLFISVDKFTGIALDSINRPKTNFIKVVYMAVANIVGDIVVIFFIGKILLFIAIAGLIVPINADIFGLKIQAYNFSVLNTLEMVSFVTILFTLIGIIVGIKYLNQYLDLSLRKIITEGWKFFLTIIKDIKSVFNV
jgi:O-antigen/teichoic acid export membrane protein